MGIRLGVSLSLFLGSLSFGWWLNRRGLLSEARVMRLVHVVVKGSSPLVLCLSFWRMNLRSAQPWLLPLLGLVISASTLLPALLYARRAQLPRPQTGSFLTCAFFSNVGYLGAFTAFALFGEAAYGLCILYLVFFTPCFYTLGFGIASRYGHKRQPTDEVAALHDDLRLYPFIGMIVGAVLSLSGVPRPSILEGINHVLIPVDTVLYLIATGSQLTFASPRPWLRACVALSGIKFLYAPLIAWLLLNLLNLHGLPRLIVLLEASTPVAVSPLVLPLLFGLDRRFSNALWLFTTIVAIPWLFFVIPLLRRF